MVHKYNFIEKKSTVLALENIFRYPYIVITAPMGYGKSTAVREFLNSRDVEYAWISLGIEQTSPVYIWDRLISQLKKQNILIGKKLDEIGFPKNINQILEVIYEIEERTCNSKFVLVIDDYQLVNCPEIDNFINILVNECFENFHIVIISRKEPNTNVNELIIKGICYKIEQDLLEFTEAEVSEYLEANECDVSEEEIQEIFSYTEGWIAAIYLIAMSIKKTGAFRKNYTIDKFMEEIAYSQYTEEEKETLLKLSVLDSYNVEQAKYITENNDIENILWNLSQKNSFLRYDSVTGQYKIHNILNNFLYSQLKNSNLIDKTELINKASKWFLENNDLLSACIYLLKIENYNKILEELSKEGSIIVIEKYFNTFKEIFDSIPRDYKLAYPLAYISYAYGVAMNKNREEAEKIIEEIENYYGSSNEEVTEEIYLARYVLNFNSAKQLPKENKLKRKIVNHSKVLDEKSAYMINTAIISLKYSMNSGEFKDYAESLEEKYKSYIGLFTRNTEGFHELVMAEYYLETMDLDNALLYSEKSRYEVGEDGLISLLMCIELVNLRIYYYRNQLDKCQNILENLDKLSKKIKGIGTCNPIGLCKVYIQMLMGKEDGATLRLASKMYKSCSFSRFSDLVNFQILLKQKKYMRLKVVAEKIKRISKEEKLQLAVIYTGIYEAIANYNLYGLESGKATLIESLKEAEADKIIMPFVELKDYVSEMINAIKAEEGAINDKYLNSIVSAINIKYHSMEYELESNKEEVEQNFTEEKEIIDSNIDYSEKVKLLTKREVEVLENIALGMTNKEVAKRLYISDYTVKTILSNIYRKLEVKGRIEAIKVLQG